MANWTYSGDPRKSRLDKVRALIGDTDATQPWTLLDAEIMSNIDDSPSNVFLAAAYSAEMVLAKLKSTVNDQKVGDLSVTFNTDMLKEFATRAQQLRSRATLASVTPWVGGTSVSEKRAQDADPDRVQPAFKVDGMSKVNPNMPDPWTGQ